MTGRKWVSGEDDVIRLTFWSKSASDTAALLPGRTTRAVSHRAKVLGLKKSPQERGRIMSAKWAAALEKRLGEPICDWLARRYVVERGTYREIVAELGINTRTLMRLMRECGIVPITPREAVLRQMARNPDFLNDMIAASRTDKAICKRAKTRERNWAAVQTPREFRFLVALAWAGMIATPELAIDRFNIDFAFPRDKLAVELDPPWHKSKRKAEIDGRKDALLAERGWTVLRLDSRTSTSYNVDKVRGALKSLPRTQP